MNHPIISAPMGNVSGGLLATEVTKARNLDLIGGGYCDTDWVIREFDLLACID